MPKLGDDLPRVVRVVLFYVVFLVVMACAGLVVACVLRLDVIEGRAIVFTGATRNSLVVLPLALPDNLAITAVVVAQILVEMVGMVVYVRAVPKLLPARQSHGAS